MPDLPRLKIPGSNDGEAQPLSQIDATNAVRNSGSSGPTSSRPSAARSYSLGMGNFGSSNGDETNSNEELLPLPVTAKQNDPTSPLSPTTRRNRAHTVSVSIRPPVRRDSTPQAIPETANQSKSRRISIGRRSDESRARRDSVREPVNFDMGPSEGLSDEVVGMLDCIDPQVSTVNHLQNMSNTLVFPHLPALWSRRPEVVIPPSPVTGPSQSFTAPDDVENNAGRRASVSRPRAGTVSRLFPPASDATAPLTTTTAPGTAKFAPILEHDELDVTDQELEHDVDDIEKDDQLDHHVRSVLKDKSKRATAKRIAKGVWTYIKTPMGFIVAIYGFLVVFWGAAIVLFLLNWIPTSSKDKQKLWIEISSQVENGLFTITGVGLIPWRVTDSFRMFVVWRLRRKITQRRKARGLPPIEDPNDIPDPRENAEYVSVLTADEQRQLLLHQEKFAQSQTWYKPHATATHTAFPITWAWWNTLLMNGNSLFQCALCGCMWGLNRFNRPAWTTGTFMPMSFLCGIGAAVLIWQGTVQTKKRVTVEQKLRSALGIHLAIGGIPQTKDGTIIATEDRAAGPRASSRRSSNTGSSDTVDKDPKAELSDVAAALKEGRTDLEAEERSRRATVSMGHVADLPVTRGRSATVPGVSSPISPGAGEGVEGMELKEVRSRFVEEQ